MHELINMQTNDEWMNELMFKQIPKWMNEPIIKWMHKLINKQTDVEWMNELMIKWIPV